ncbi:transient receptor potential cation channel subfamily A member 1 homolog [Mercenaria mercenaria]|uniref:transient receptor potential cation channel subfamily A member 1 homolog n=1 Tax=Mercenaria mercenaria TaxID=6596 RepID=UPI00234F4AF1|nr:transient receptor potential cation channel subfamily A member 1 homolog [Mercenaria mercenaria]
MFDFSVSADAMKVCLEDNDTYQSIPVFASYAKYGVIIIASIELLIEVVEMKQMFSCKVWLYFLEVENVIEWITCTTAIIFVVNLNGCSDTGFRPQWQWSCGTVSVFLAWINMLFIIQKFEWFGIYVVMLFRVAKVFMKFFLVFFLLIVAFAVSFHGLFQNQEQFSTVWISVVKTTAMMIGEIDFGTIFFDEVVHYEYISYMFFYIFLMFMTIVLINLLVGLSVENIQEFQKEADLTKKEMQVKFALEVERISTSSLILKCLNFLRCKRSANSLSQKEKFWPNRQTWLQRKLAESWKLTEKDIKMALIPEKDGTSKEIARLDTKFNTLETNLLNMDSKLEKILQCLRDDWSSDYN